jgi:hypothetical protein
MQQQSSPMLPAQLEGVWTSDDPRYSDRFLELPPTFVMIVTGRHERSSVQWIDKVNVESAGDRMVLTVYSTDFQEGTHHELALQVSPANGGEIRLRNQSQVWKRRENYAR